MDNDVLSNAINKLSKCAVKEVDPWIIYLPQWCYSNNDKNLQRPFARYEPYFSIYIRIRCYRMYIYDKECGTALSMFKNL